MPSQKKHLMKNTVQLFLCLIFGFYNAQVTTTLPTTSQIDAEIEKTNKLTADEAIVLSNTVYNSSKKMGYKKGMLESSTVLIAKYFDTGDFKKVIDLSKDAENLAQELKDNVKLANIYRLRASAYTELGFNDESIKEFRKALQLSDKIESNNKKKYIQALIYTGIGAYFAHVNAPLDSVISYQRKILGSALSIDNSEDFLNRKYGVLAIAYLNLGKTSVASQKIKDAEIYFSKSLEISQNKKYVIDKNLETTVYNEYAWLHYDQKQYDKAVYYADKAEKLEKQIRIPYIRRDIYEVYFKSYVELGEKDASKKYMNLYTKLNDSLVNAEKKAINTPVGHLIEKQGKVHADNIYKVVYLAIGAVVVCILAGLFFWRRNKKRLHDRYENIVKHLHDTEKPSENNSEPKITADKSINITDETVNAILLKLDKFEKNHKFIKKDLSLTSLANELNTNTRYLSEIIKQYKGKNYNHYINSLRIEYITNKLYESPIYREYKISYLAEACGFSSREVFAVTFKKETGVTPSYFISNLRKDYQEISFVKDTPGSET